MIDDFLLFLDHTDHSIVIEHLMGTQVLGQVCLSHWICGDLWISDLTFLVREVVVVFRYKLGLVLWSKHRLFIHLLMELLDFLSLVLLAFPEQSLLDCLTWAVL